MIHGVSANQPSFQRVRLTTGMNVILAERTEASTQKDTRNGLGKSTLVEIIDFCLGANAVKGRGLVIEPLQGWAFTLDITLAGNRVEVTRSVDATQRVVVSGSTDGWIEQPVEDDSTGQRVLRLTAWRTVLGWALFGLVAAELTHKYKPSFRSLISYSIRRGPDAFSDPFRHARQQQPWDVQVNAGYLLGVNWEYAAQWQEIKDKEKALKALGDAIKSGAMEGALGSIGELDAECIRLESLVEEEQRALDSFRVHPQYENIQQEADRLTKEIHALSNENVVDQRRLTRYRESVSQEGPPSDEAVDRLYAESGLVFPDAVRRTLAEAKRFHSQVVDNRRSFLETEIRRLEQALSDRSERIKSVTEMRAAQLSVLRTHGALQELTTLQQNHTATRGQLERVQARVSELRDLTSRRREQKVAKTELARTASTDHEERRVRWSIPVKLFNDNSQALYKRPGKLVIDIGESGFKYDVEINRAGSEGVGKMKIFCFDLMLLQLSAQSATRPRFLIHDSILFDGVDSRQRALALEQANAAAVAEGCQYICTMNSDMVPHDDFTPDFGFDECVRLTLTDRTPAGSLLGFRYERPR